MSLWAAARVRLAGVERAAGGDPRLEAPVEYRNPGVPQPAQQPPGASRKGAIGIIVGDYLRGFADAELTQPGGDEIGRRQRMAAAAPGSADPTDRG